MCLNNEIIKMQSFLKLKKKIDFRFIGKSLQANNNDKSSPADFGNERIKKI